MPDTIVPFNMQESQINRIIGLEFRIVSPNGSQEEIAIFPLDVKVPVWRFNVTVHTKYGDRNSQNTDL